MTPISRRIIVIAGFTQKRYASTGMHRLYQRLRERYRDLDTEVSFHPWNENWQGFAKLVEDQGPEDLESMDVRVAAYSWGVGHGAMTLARELRGRGITIRRLTSIDGVYHSYTAPWRAMFWLKLLGTPRIIVPVNVNEVWMLRQRENHPQGHEIVPQFEALTKVLDYGYVDGMTHQDMDNAPQAHRLAMEGFQCDCSP